MKLSDMLVEAEDEKLARQTGVSLEEARAELKRREDADRKMAEELAEPKVRALAKKEWSLMWTPLK